LESNNIIWVRKVTPWHNNGHMRLNKTTAENRR